MTRTGKQAWESGHWNRCDVCGRIIATTAFESGAALRSMATPDSDYSSEEYETLCTTCNEKRKAEQQ